MFQSPPTRYPQHPKSPWKSPMSSPFQPRLRRSVARPHGTVLFLRFLQRQHHALRGAGGAGRGAGGGGAGRGADALGNPWENRAGKSMESPQIMGKMEVYSWKNIIFFKDRKRKFKLYFWQFFFGNRLVRPLYIYDLPLYIYIYVYITRVTFSLTMGLHDLSQPRKR